MSKIVGIGANVCDTLFTLPVFPKEDTKIKADKVTLSGGGPCATGLVAASKLGAECAFLGVLTDDNAGKFLKEDMERYNVSTKFIKEEKGYVSFSSCIWLSEETATRTCVFYRGDVPKLVLDESRKNAIKNAEILMIDGNEMSAAAEAVKIARENGTKVLYDAGGLYDGVEKLLPYTDILIPSEEFALKHTGAKTVEEASKKLMELYHPDVVVVTMGKNGGVIFDGRDLKHYDAFEVNVVDTNGAGDVFHGAFAFGVTMGYNYYKCCVFSSAVSALKCMGVGARKSVPTFDETMKFLKECGINEFEENLD